MTIAATQSHGCRSGTASIAAGLSGGDDTSTLMARLRSADRAVDNGLVDHALLDTPVGGDGLVIARFDEVLERLLQYRAQCGALLDRPAVGRRVEDLTRLLELAVALLDRIQRHRRIRRHRVGLTERHGIGGCVLAV